MVASLLFAALGCAQPAPAPAPAPGPPPGPPPGGPPPGPPPGGPPPGGPPPGGPPPGGPPPGPPPPGPPPAPEKTWELKVSAFLPEQSGGGKYCIDPNLRRIEEATNGRVKLTFYHAGVIAHEPTAWEAVESGLCDIAYVVTTGFYPGRVPLSCLLTLPMLGIPSCQASAAIMQGIYDKFPVVQNEYKGAKVLYFQSSPAEHINMVDKPVRSIDDLKGLKLMVLGGYGKYFLKEAGAVPMSVIPPDMFVSLERGTIDGTLFNFLGMETWKCYPLTKTHTIVNMSRNLWAMMVNQDTWDSFTPDIQDAIMNEVSGLKGSDPVMMCQDDLVKKTADLYASPEVGNEMIYLSAEELQKWQDIARPIWEKEIVKLEREGLPGRAVFDEILRLAEKYRAGS